LNGKLIRRTVVADGMSLGQAYTSDGRFYVRTRGTGTFPELRVLNLSDGTWTTLPANLPERAEFDRAFLLGADGEDLVYRIGYGNVRLMWARPGAK
jgi:hypothetical protein